MRSAIRRLRDIRIDYPLKPFGTGEGASPADAGCCPAMTLHLDIPTRTQLDELLSTREPACVSIYLPTSPLPQDSDAARIGFKGLAGEAVEQLGDERRVAAAVREQLDGLLDDEELWN